MNSREQELDEAAIIKSALFHPQGFVAQHHTRCSAYLARQLQSFKLAPIVTFRNVLDCVVSFDDMMLKWRKHSGDTWYYDAQFALPLNYVAMSEPARYDLLA